MMLGDINKFLLPQNSTGFVVGWRYWFKEEERLKSLTTFGYHHANAPRLWTLNKPMVGNPDKMGDCYMMGVYAKRPYQTHLELDLRSHVAGFIALWGTVRTGPEGFRAQYAYPLTLNDEELADLYGCEHLSTAENGRLPENEAKEYLIQHENIWLPANVEDFPRGS